MRGRRVVAAICMLAVLGLGGLWLSGLVRTPGPNTPGTSAPSFTVQRGVNLEGWLDQAQFSGFDDRNLSQLPAIRAAGFDFVRLLLHPLPLIDSHGSEPAATLERVLHAARQADLKVLVSFYDDNARDKEALVQEGQAQETYLALLERTARLLAASDPHWVALEPITEMPDCVLSASAWMGLQARFVQAARRGDPGLTVLISGRCYSDYDSLSDLRPLDDPNVLYGFLYVEPLLFTQQGNPENPDWAAFRNVPYPFGAQQLSPVLKTILAGVPSPERRLQVRQAFTDLAQSDFTRATLKGQIARAGNWARQNSVTVLLSAFAVRRSAPPTDRARWFRDVRLAAEANRMPWAVWSWTSPYGFDVSEHGALQPELRKALGLP